MFSSFFLTVLYFRIDKLKDETKKKLSQQSKFTRINEEEKVNSLVASKHAN
jgi:hypothetical protein